MVSVLMHLSLFIGCTERSVNWSWLLPSKNCVQQKLTSWVKKGKHNETSRRQLFIITSKILVFMAKFTIVCSIDVLQWIWIKNRIKIIMISISFKTGKLIHIGFEKKIPNCHLSDFDFQADFNHSHSGSFSKSP